MQETAPMRTFEGIRVIDVTHFFRLGDGSVEHPFP